MKNKKRKKKRKNKKRQKKKKRKNKKRKKKKQKRKKKKRNEKRKKKRKKRRKKKRKKGRPLCAPRATNLLGIIQLIDRSYYFADMKYVLLTQTELLADCFVHTNKGRQCPLQDGNIHF